MIHEEATGPVPVFPEPPKGFRWVERRGVFSLAGEAMGDFPFVDHAFCSRWRGASEGPFSGLNLSTREGDAEESVRKNGEILSAAFDLPVKRFATVRQVHGNRIIHLESTEEGSRLLEADGIITTCEGLAVGIKTADCVPILLLDPRAPAVGAVHAGWRGTAAGIAREAVEAMKKAFSSDPSEMIALIGPAIGPCCYEVDEPVRLAMTGEKGMAKFLRPLPGRAGRWMMDLAGANAAQLADAGLRDNQVHGAGLCTACHRTVFFSHRGDRGTTGRQINFILIRPPA